MAEEPRNDRPRGGEFAVGADEEQAAISSARFQRAVAATSPIFSVILAMLIGSLVILIAGQDPVEAYKAMFQGAFGNARQIGETLLAAAPLLLTGLALTWGFRAGLFNIGAEGQLFMGGLAAAWLGVVLGFLPWPVLIPIMLVGAALAGAAWAFIPAIMKARLGAHEVITTMMFSYIARYLVSWLINGPLQAPGATPQTVPIAESARLPRISEVFTFIDPNRAHFGLILGIVLAFVIWWMLKYTVLGFEARAVGFNPLASENGGISVAATTVKALCISGALAALAGATEVMGVHDRLFDAFSSGFGFTGIAVALLAKNNPIGVIPAAILFGALSAGSGTMQLQADVSQKVVTLIQGIIIFLVGADVLVRIVKKRIPMTKGVVDAAR